MNFSEPQLPYVEKCEVGQIQCDKLSPHEKESYTHNIVCSFEDSKNF